MRFYCSNAKAEWSEVEKPLFIEKQNYDLESLVFAVSKKSNLSDSRICHPPDVVTVFVNATTNPLNLCCEQIREILLMHISPH